MKVALVQFLIITFIYFYKSINLIREVLWRASLRCCSINWCICIAACRHNQNPNWIICVNFYIHWFSSLNSSFVGIITVFDVVWSPLKWPTFSKIHEGTRQRLFLFFLNFSKFPYFLPKEQLDGILIIMALYLNRKIQ